MSEQGGGLDFRLLLCSLADHTVVSLPGKLPQNFCEPGRAGVVREIHPLRLCRSLSVCLQGGAGMLTSCRPQQLCSMCQPEDRGV